MLEAEEDHPWLSNNSVERDSLELRPSLTVKELTLMVNWEHFELDDFRDIFPNVRKFETSNQEYSLMSIPYESLWREWPELESIDLEDGMSALDINFDAEFLGIEEEEVERLRDECHDDEALQHMHVVPIKPSILTMRRKKDIRVIEKFLGTN